LDIDPEEPDYNPEKDDVPNTINGLTFSEVKTALRRVSGDWISDREQARGCNADARGEGG